MLGTAAPVPRSAIAIGLDPDLRPSFAERAGGRTLAIGYYASRMCGNILVGDLQLEWLHEGAAGDTRLPAGFIALAPIEGVGIAADERLLELLASSGATIGESGPPFARGLNLRLDDAAAWLDFLDSPLARRRIQVD